MIALVSLDFGGTRARRRCGTHHRLRSCGGQRTSRRHKTIPVVRTVSSISKSGPIATRLTSQSTAACSSDFQSCPARSDAGLPHMACSTRCPGPATSVRGRDASYLAPPAQIRTGPIRAYGSHLRCVTARRDILPKCRMRFSACDTVPRYCARPVVIVGNSNPASKRSLIGQCS
jgi:hypothetical protein